jgi:serine/threonine protein kinase
MSPEGLLSNIYGPKTDVWAFGVILFEILHGYPPMNYCKT